MILIFSEFNDSATNNVLEWLTSFEKSYTLINELNKITDLNILLNNLGEKNIEFIVNNKEICLKDISAVWYRRGTIIFNCNYENPDLPKSLENQN